jgi:hypothetical protein
MTLAEDERVLSFPVEAKRMTALRSPCQQSAGGAPLGQGLGCVAPGGDVMRVRENLQLGRRTK